MKDKKEMRPKSRTIELQAHDPSNCSFITDPVNNKITLLEGFLNFKEAKRLRRGNANVRPPDDVKKPFKAMLQTAESNPQKFHQYNRGIVYICNKVEYDKKTGKITLEIPDSAAFKESGEEVPRYGIADGGHTFEIINRVVLEEKEYLNITDWMMPYVKVRFIAGENPDDIENTVEALNTSLQVQQYTLDEYNKRFEPLKEALEKSGFDIGLVAFREGEDKEWHIIEIIQRLACFLKERWVGNQPSGMYKSKSKALRLFTNSETQPEFEELYSVIKDIITLPEYIQSQLSTGEYLQGRKLGKIRSVKTLKKPTARTGTDFSTMHRIDMAALLPMAAGFRELLTKKGDTYQWRIPVQEVFARCAPQLYDLMVQKSLKVRTASELSSDNDYWSGCQMIVTRAKESIIDGEPMPKIKVRKKVVAEEIHDEVDEREEVTISATEADDDNK